MSPEPASPAHRKTAIVVIIGNEILGGYTLDTNSHYLSEILRENGVACTARHTIRDDKEEIKRFLRLTLEDSPDYLFLCGGLGPTHDDVSFEAVAEALQKRLVLSEAAIKNIQDRLDVINCLLPREKQVPMNDASRKMAMVPEGTRVLTNKAGTAPAVAIRVKASWLFLLPGVPHELKWIFENEILGSYIEGELKDYVVEIPVRRGESNFARELYAIQVGHPEVKIGSYPQPGRVVLRVAGARKAVELVERKIRERIPDSGPLNCDEGGE